MWTQTLKSDHRGLAVILGARSWVGNSLSRELINSGWVVVGTTSKDTAMMEQSESSVFVQANEQSRIASIIQSCRPHVVVNLRFGVDQNEFDIHQAAATATEKVNAHYVYSSSALALDAYGPDQLLVEDLPSNAKTEYGLFKSKCENDLMGRTGLSSLILRFSSIHGWNPWKDSRTVAFLCRINRGETVVVDQGIVQNRMSDRMLAETIRSLIVQRSVGTAHIGTADSSEEFDFLRTLASAFGYTDKNIVRGQSKPTNLAVVPSLGLHPTGPKSESDTIADLRERIELASYFQKNQIGSKTNG